MNKIEYFERERYKAKQLISNICNALLRIDQKIEELKKSKKKTDDIINKFEIKCYDYNLVEEFIESRNNLANKINEISKALNKNYNINNKNVEGYIKRIYVINDVLDQLVTQIKLIDKKQLEEVEKLQMNAIKYGIYCKFMILKSKIDSEKVKEKYNKIENHGVFIKAYEKFFLLENDTIRKKENLFFTIKEINDAKNRFEKNEEPQKEYTILGVLADIESFLKEYPKEKKFEDEINEIKKLKYKIREMFFIDEKQLRLTIKNKQRNKLPILIDKKMNKTLKEQRKIIAFLNKNGYTDINESKNSFSYMKLVIDKLNVLSNSIKI